MKFIHLSDLHLGKRVNEISMTDDQSYILTQIIDMHSITLCQIRCKPLFSRGLYFVQRAFVNMVIFLRDIDGPVGWCCRPRQGTQFTGLKGAVFIRNIDMDIILRHPGHGL